MKRRNAMILTLVALIAAGCFIWFSAPDSSDDPAGMLPRFLARLSQPHPHSDVGITSDVGWWPFQEGLKVSEFTAEAVNPKLGMFNNGFLIRYSLKGTVKFREEWRPRIAEAQITERVVSRQSSTPSTPMLTVANLLIVPIVKVRQDRSYEGADVPFNMTIEQIVHTMNWGQNLYEINCGDKTASVSVVQLK